MDNKKAEVWQCPACRRLLYRSKVSVAQAWYVPETNLEGKLAVKEMIGHAQRRLNG